MMFSWLNEFKKDTEAFALLRDWLGKDATPVDRAEAERRAMICTACPLNRFQGWYDRAKDAIAGTIRKQIEIKNKIGLKTTLDDDLSMCEACGCAIKLKVWVPMEHIASHTNQETLNKFTGFCWVRKGIHEKKAPTGGS